MPQLAAVVEEWNLRRITSVETATDWGVPVDAPNFLEVTLTGNMEPFEKQNDASLIITDRAVKVSSGQFEANLPLCPTGREDVFPKKSW